MTRTTTSRPRRRWAGPAALAATLVVLAACGSSGDDDAGSATTASGTTTGATTTVSSGATTTPTTPTPGATTTAGGATTTAPAHGDLPPCPVDALASASGPVSIDFWHAMTAANEEALKQLVSQYNASQAKVQVNLVNQTGYEQNIDKYRTSSAKDRPALVQLPEYVLKLVTDSQTVVPVQSCIEAEGYDTADYLPRAVSYYTLDGALQTMPFNVSNPVLFYNKAMFAKAGLDPEKPPTTLEELRAASEALVSSGAATYGLAVDTGIDSGGGWFLEQWRAKADELFVNNGNGRQAPATEVLFADQNGVDLLTFMQGMVKDGLAVNVGANASGQDTLLKMADAEQPAAMAIYSSAGLGSVLNVLRAGTIKTVTEADLGVGAMPGPSGGGVLVGGASLWLSKDKGDEQTAAAWDFAKWLTQPEQQSQWAAATGYVPVRTSATEMAPLSTTYTSDPRFRVAWDQLNEGKEDDATAGAVLGPQRQVRQEVADATEAIFGGADVATRLQQAAEASNKLIAEYAKRVGG